MDNQQAPYPSRTLVVPFDPPKIEIDVICGDYLRLDEFARDDNSCGVDAIAVGHYAQRVPRGLLRDLDKAITRSHLANMQTEMYQENALDDAQLLLTQFTCQGVITGELAQLFFLNDPRVSGSERLIVIGGLGIPGQFGEPELTLLVRKLCWSLGRMGKRHLAVPLIGAGRGNLSMDLATSGWVRGIKLAITGEDDQNKLERITFVIRSERAFSDFLQGLRREQDRLIADKRMLIDLNWYAWSDHLHGVSKRQNEAADDAPKPAYDLSPTLVTVTLDEGMYRFGGITDSAAIPLRDVQLDSSLANQINDELVTVDDIKKQIAEGQFLHCFLIPQEFRSHLHSSTPLILRVDKTTACYHWERLADLYPTIPVLDELGGDRRAFDDSVFHFWGTSRGLTRQLQTTYAPIYDSPPPPKRVLRALVIADPASDASLCGAKKEGECIAKLLMQFNVVQQQSLNRISVCQLIGPHQATRANVLRHLMTHTYDVLHFAGHCIYDEGNPAMSGWLFSNGERFTAYELARVDRVPGFVFSK